MLSIIICSRSSKISKELEENIKNKIGIEYELIIIDNSKNEYSIFSAYNLGAKLSKYPYLCFMHEDILFHTQDWGRKVINHFVNSYVGIIGVAGSHYLPRIPGSWFSSILSTINVLHTINGKTVLNLWNNPDNKGNSINAVILDGLWLCIPKNVMDVIAFDDKTFSDFHCYDSDICLQIKRLNYDVRIVNDIQIEHYSVGKLDKIWLRNIFIFFDKWKRELPVSTINADKTMVSNANYIFAKHILEGIRINKFGILYTFKIWSYYIRSNPLIYKRNCLLLLVLIKKLYLPEPLRSLKILNRKFT